MEGGKTDGVTHERIVYRDPIWPVAVELLCFYRWPATTITNADLHGRE